MNKLAVVLAPCLCLVASAAQAVELKHGWKPGMNCHVQYHRQQDGGVRTGMHFVWKTSAAPDGGLLFTTEQVGSPSRPSGPKPSPQEAVHIASMVMPSFRVSADGKFAGLHDIETARKATESVFDSLSGNPDAGTKTRVMEMIGSKVMLENSARQLWAPAVESWVGSSWQPGQKFETAIDTVLPIGNLPYKAKHVAEFQGPRSCKQEQPPRCVLLTSSQMPDPESLAKAMAPVMDSFGSRASGDRIDNIDVRVNTATVTRPHTLVPALVTFEKLIQVRGVEKGKPMEQSIVEKRDWVFDCG